MIKMTQAIAQIGIKSIQTELSVHTVQPELRMNRQDPQVEIHSDLPRVQIEQYQCFAEMGLKNIGHLTKENAQKGMRKSMAYIAKLVQDGDRMAAIENGSNAIAAIAKRDSFPPERQTNVDVIPKSRPRVEVSGELRIRFQPGTTQFSTNPGRVDIHASRPRLEIYLTQKAALNIEFTGNTIDTQL